MKKFFAAVALLFLCACQSYPETTQPVAMPAPKAKPVHNKTPIVGGVETAYIIPFATPFHARMDTGAETSSVDAKNLRPFERDGEKWIAFDIINRKNGEKQHFEKPIKRKTSIVRSKNAEKRYVVQMKIKMGKQLINTEFTLTDRDNFEYQLLIGRNIINGRYIIDPTQKNTLH